MEKKISSYLFEYYLKESIEAIEDTLSTKQFEYADGDEDRMHNFNRAARVSGCTPERALYGMMAKHLISVMDILDDMDEAKHPTASMVDEKFGDLINYLVLLKIMIRDKVLGETV